MAEVSRPNFRGAFGNSLSLSVAIGITLAMVLGALMNWRTLAISLSLIPLLGTYISSVSSEMFDFSCPCFVWKISNGANRGSKAVMHILNKFGVGQKKWRTYIYIILGPGRKSCGARALEASPSLVPFKMSNHHYPSLT